jgi:ankyrin repeat protein
VAAGGQVNAKMQSGATPLHFAAEKGHHSVARFLLEKRADVNATYQYNRSALYNAAFAGHAEVVRVLLDKGAAINAKTEEGTTALHAGLEYPDVVKVLLDGGADVNVREKIGRTPLHEAAVNGYFEAAKLLLEAGADPNAQDNLGRIPLHETAGESITDMFLSWLMGDAEGEEDEEADEETIRRNAARVNVADLLLDAGAKVNAQNEDGLTPLSLAIENGRKSLADLLRQHGGVE